MYYDIYNAVAIPNARLREMGLADKTPAELAKIGIYNFVISGPLEVDDPKTQGIRPAGQPVTDINDPYTCIQVMEIYSLVDDLRQKKLDALAQKRWSCQCANLIFPDGAVFKTAPDDVSRMGGLLQAMRAQGIDAADFKAASGWLTVSCARLDEVYGAISLYVQECFANERKLHEQVLAASSLDELNAIDIGAGWPANEIGGSAALA